MNLVPTPQPSLLTPLGLPLKALHKASGQQELASMRQCPKFVSCSAPICPLDPNWHLRDMTGSDASCAWFREVAKAGPTAQCVPEAIRDKVAAALTVILPSWGLAPLRSALKRAALTGSKRFPSKVRSLLDARKELDHAHAVLN